jgi:hypothetical protein
MQKWQRARKRRIQPAIHCTAPENVSMISRIDIPEVVVEVSRAFVEYEQALSNNDLDTIDSLFWNSPLTLRYGPNGTLLGHQAISAFRRARDIKGIKRIRRDTVITTFGTDFAVTNTESDHDGVTTRQSQTWVRMIDGWRIVSAHVSNVPLK